MKLTHLLALLPLAAFANTQSAHPNPGPSGVLEFDLVFPRNETYASTQYFPLVLAVCNSTAAWPHGLRVRYHLWPHHLEAPPSEGLFELPETGATSGAPPSAPNYFFIEGSNLMNATSGGFTLIWSVILRNTCRDDDPFGDTGQWAYHSRERNVKFTIAEGAPLRDIEAAVNACSTPDSTLAITPRGWRDGVCPVVRNNDTTPSAATPCGLKPVAKDIAQEVSTVMLGLMGCSDGMWQTIKSPCLPGEKNEGFRRAADCGLLRVLIFIVLTAFMF
ncbi:hypothetical protein PG993_005494 [Apiospora rasikravindrae]|uniref:DUF7136 domain-containing protein n=1 Tax=Apiospora rasikravindrae TaxID=990691 RepID=A0ABR1THP1_9PEZI